MNLLDILLLRSLVKGAGGGSSDEYNTIIQELETKVSKEEMEIYVTQTIDELPTISEEELNNILV